MSQFVIQALLQASEVASNAVQLSAQVVQLQQSIQFLTLQLAGYGQNPANGDAEIARLEQTIEQMRAGYHAELQQQVERITLEYRNEAMAYLEAEINKQRSLEAKANAFESQLVESRAKELSLEEELDASTRRMAQTESEFNKLRLQHEIADQQLKANANLQGPPLNELDLLRKQNRSLNEELDEFKAKLTGYDDNDIGTQAQLATAPAPPNTHRSKKSERRIRWDAGLKNSKATKPEFEDDEEGTAKVTSKVTEEFNKSRIAGNIIKDRKKANKTRQSKRRTQYNAHKLEDLIGGMSLTNNKPDAERKGESDGSEDMGEEEL